MEWRSKPERVNEAAERVIARGWRPWFAWHPVTIGKKTVWLTRVERRGRGPGLSSRPIYFWEYRGPNPTTQEITETDKAEVCEVQGCGQQAQATLVLKNGREVHVCREHYYEIGGLEP